MSLFFYYIFGEAEVREVFAQVLADFGIRYTRIPVEPGLHACPLIPPHLHEFYIQVQKDALSSVEVFRRHGIRLLFLQLLMFKYFI